MRKSRPKIKNETMTRDEQRKARARAMGELAGMELAELRQILDLSQEELAAKMKVSQVAISRLERRPNIQLETLSSYIKALGGTLELQAVLPNRTIVLTHLITTRERNNSLRSEKKKRASRSKAVVSIA
jgi:transcriptional regulator with XRE-family HTH domain